MNAVGPDPAASDAFYARIAARYDEEFVAPHRAAYDRLAWEAVTDRCAGSSAPLNVVDVGCGTGRWSRLLVGAGHRVIGVEPCDEMAVATETLTEDGFVLQRCGVDDARVDPGWADLVIAMGSLQYTPDPAASIARAAGWLRPGGTLAVLMDSLGGLVLELLARGDRHQATERAESHMARWARDGAVVSYHLFDATRLRSAYSAAGIVDIDVRGLLVSYGVTAGDGRAAPDYSTDRVLDTERRLSRVPSLADTGKQLLAIGTKGVP